MRREGTIRGRDRVDLHSGLVHSLNSGLITIGRKVAGAHESNRLKAAYAAKAKGEYQTALEHLIWFHEHALEETRALLGIRLSYALAVPIHPPLQPKMQLWRHRSERVRAVFLARG